MYLHQPEAWLVDVLLCVHVITAKGITAEKSVEHRNEHDSDLERMFSLM